MFMGWVTQPEAWVALLILTALEIVLGIDNIIFISILVKRVPQHQRHRVRIIGLSLAMGTRILLLATLAWIAHFSKPLFSVLEYSFSIRDLILIFGGLFLIGKSTFEIHHSFEEEEKTIVSTAKANILAILVQIAIIDIVFSLDSVITAVGMARDLGVMVTAVVLSVFVMMYASRGIGDFVDKHPSIKMLALSFLIMIGVALLGEGFGMHIPKGYIYFSMFFSFSVEMLNLTLQKKKTKTIKLSKNYPAS